MKFRIDNGLRKMDVARQMGVAPSMIADWETGRYQPNDANMKKISEFIGYDLLFKVS